MQLHMDLLNKGLKSKVMIKCLSAVTSILDNGVLPMSSGVSRPEE